MFDANTLVMNETKNINAVFIVLSHMVNLNLKEKSKIKLSHLKSWPKFLYGNIIACEINTECLITG